MVVQPEASEKKKTLSWALSACFSDKTPSRLVRLKRFVDPTQRFERLCLVERQRLCPKAVVHSAGDQAAMLKQVQCFFRLATFQLQLAKLVQNLTFGTQVLVRHRQLKPFAEGRTRGVQLTDILIAIPENFERIGKHDIIRMLSGQCHSRFGMWQGLLCIIVGQNTPGDVMLNPCQFIAFGEVQRPSKRNVGPRGLSGIALNRRERCQQVDLGMTGRFTLWEYRETSAHSTVCQVQSVPAVMDDTEDAVEIRTRDGVLRFGQALFRLQAKGHRVFKRATPLCLPGKCSVRIPFLNVAAVDRTIMNMVQNTGR